VLTETAEATGVPCCSGGIHQGWAAQPEERISACTGGGEAYPECAACDRAVPGGCRSEYWHCGQHNRFVTAA